MKKPRVVIILQEDCFGFDVVTDEACEILVVSDFTPNDRVYRMKPHTVGPDFVDSVLGDSDIGHSGDARHEAVRHRIRSVVEGRPHLQLVGPDDEGGGP